MINNQPPTKLRKKPYRDAYVKAHLQQGLAYQIAALRKHCGWSQQELAKRLGLKNQSAVARMEDPSYGKFSLTTLLKLSSVFDVALSARFVAFSDFVSERADLSDAALAVRSFNEEDQMDTWIRALDRVKINGPATLPDLLLNGEQWLTAANSFNYSGQAITSLRDNNQRSEKYCLAS